jgi:predicted nucleotidyltransferase
MEFGLPERTLETLRRILAAHPEIEQALIYGSRAKGTQRQGSDIDLALCGDAVDSRVLLRVARELDESSIPYTVDLCRFEEIGNPALREHITRVGRVLYRRTQFAAG